MPQQKKSDFLQDLIIDYALLHNVLMREAISLKNIHDVLLGAKNALDDGAYDDLTYNEFKELITQDLEDIYNKR